MDLAKRKTDLEAARDRAAAQLHAILGQLQLVDELLAEPVAAPDPAHALPNGADHAIDD